jgi:putative glycosyl hydrolase-like family 15 (GHL15) protein
MLSAFAGLPGSAATSVPAGGGFPSTGRYIQHWAPTYMTPTTTYTQAQAVVLAQNFDIVAAHPNNHLDQWIPAMKAANPNFRILIYFNGSFVPPNLASFYPANYYAHDALGNKITSTNFGNYLMDVGLTAWASAVVSLCQSKLAAAPYDGCFVDMLGDALVVHPGYLSSTPINPKTGLAWTQQDRMTATTAIAQAVATKIAPKLMMANGLAAGYRYFATTAPTSQLLNGAPSGQAETWLRQATRPITTFETEAAWLQDINMLADVATKGKAITVTVKVWIPATPAQIDQWHKYSLASFWMGQPYGMPGSAYYAFLAPKSATMVAQVNAWDHVNIGSPTSKAGKFGGNVYQRAFTGGIALVNVSSTATYTVTLFRACTTLTGTSPVTTVTLPPESGEVCHF